MVPRGRTGVFSELEHATVAHSVKFQASRNAAHPKHARCSPCPPSCPRRRRPVGPASSAAKLALATWTGDRIGNAGRDRSFRLGEECPSHPPHACSAARGAGGARRYSMTVRLPPLRCRNNAYLLVWDGSASSLMVREVFQNVLGMLDPLAWAEMLR